MSRVMARGLRALRILGVQGALSVLRDGYIVPMRDTARSKWYRGIPAEVAFWDEYFSTRGLLWPDEYVHNLDPDFPLQEYVCDLLPQSADIHILDVGAGPLTVLGKKYTGKPVYITALDPLADEYDKILRRHRVKPVVRTQKLDAERLTSRFAQNTFDLVFARNSIDHSYDPERAILEMISVVKPSCYVLLGHAVNEGEKAEYYGFHQWNFSVNHNGEFIIRSKHSETNMTRKYSKLCSTTCKTEEIDSRGGSGKKVWLTTRMRKI